MIPDRIELDLEIPVSIDRVWAALTEPDQLGVWFGNGNRARVDLQTGGRIVFDHPPHGDVPAVIEQLTPTSTLAFRWAVIGPPGEEPTDINSTVVEFVLAPLESGTQLQLRETGFSKVQTTTQELQARYDANNAGWPRTLESLRAFLATDS